MLVLQVKMEVFLQVIIGVGKQQEDNYDEDVRQEDDWLSLPPTTCYWWSSFFTSLGLGFRPRVFFFFTSPTCCCDCASMAAPPSVWLQDSDFKTLDFNLSPSPRWIVFTLSHYMCLYLWIGLHYGSPLLRTRRLTRYWRFEQMGPTRKLDMCIAIASPTIVFNLC